MSSGLMWRFLPTDDVLIQCRRVGIINDTIEEPTEEFSVKLTNVSPAGTIVDDTSCISILDNDRKLTQQLKFMHLCHIYFISLRRVKYQMQYAPN